MRSIWTCLQVAAGVVLLQAAAPVGPATHNWLTWKSPDGSFSECYPADLLKPDPNASDLELKGAHNESAEVQQHDGTLQDALRDDTDDFDHGDGKYSYFKKTATWFVFSGTDQESFPGDKGIVYERGVLQGKTVVTMHLVYPPSEAAIFDPIVGAMGKCLVVHGGHA